MTRQSPTVPTTRIATATRLAGRLAFFMLASAGPICADTFSVTNTSDSDPGSLRQAILDANTHAGLDTITFAIPGSGPFTIQPLSMLPEVTDPVAIDASTQPGSGGLPIVELDGTNAGPVDGLRISGGGSSVRGLVINRFQQTGISVLTVGNVVITGNYIGTDVTGTQELGNGFGVTFLNCDGNRLGGTQPGEGNVISSNGMWGVALSTSSNNVIQGNRIGTDASGAAGLGNGGIAGIWLVNGSANNQIGGKTPGARNVVSASLADGIYLQLLSATGIGNTIQGNSIGTNAAGTASLPNLQAGIRIDTTSLTEVGGSGPGEGNLISGNAAAGIIVLDQSNNNTGNRIEGNFIGTDASGTAALPNPVGISLGQFSVGTTVGGTAAGARNVISGNHIGIDIINSSLNVVQGNFIGTDVTGTAALGNTSYGVGISSNPSGSQNSIGGTAAGAGNVIAFNGLGLILVGNPPTVENPILGNSIFANVGLGIDLGGDGVTPNDVGDRDTGQNELQNYPVLTSATTTGSTIAIQGSLNSAVSTAFRVEFFASPVCDASGFGQAQTFLGFTTANTDAGGNAALSVSFPAAIPLGASITATATDPLGNTSELSACAGASGSADLSVSITDGQASAIPGTAVSYTIVASNAGPIAVSAVGVVDTLPAALLGATWTCTATGGSTCTASGSGSINDLVTLQGSGTATYTLTATVDAASTGTLVNTATVVAPAGVTDPNPGNNSATDTDTLTPVADLTISKTDGQSIVIPGSPVTYTMVAANLGPSVATAAAVVDTLPATLLGATWICVPTSGSHCTFSGSGNIDESVQLAVGGSVTYTLTATVDPAATGTLVNTATVAPPGGTSDPDPSDDSATDTDTLLAALAIEGELEHGYQAQHDLAALPGPVAQVALFRILQGGHRSYEVIVDGTSGDLGPDGPLVERVASDGTTVVQESAPAGAAASRSLRWMNPTDAAVADELVRVLGAGCSTDCDAADVYRLGARETTGFVARFNNSGTQITILVLQNTGDEAMDADVQFWSMTGTPLGGPPVQTLAPHESFVLNTSGLVAGSSGSITVGNTGRYGQLAGKAVAVEPATGFTFDTGLELRPR